MFPRRDKSFQKSLFRYFKKSENRIKPKLQSIEKLCSRQRCHSLQAEILNILIPFIIKRWAGKVKFWFRCKGWKNFIVWWEETRESSFFKDSLNMRGRALKRFWIQTDRHVLSVEPLDQQPTNFLKVTSASNGRGLKLGEIINIKIYRK